MPFIQDWAKAGSGWQKSCDHILTQHQWRLLCQNRHFYTFVLPFPAFIYHLTAVLSLLRLWCLSFKQRSRKNCCHKEETFFPAGAFHTEPSAGGILPTRDTAAASGNHMLTRQGFSQHSPHRQCPAAPIRTREAEKCLRECLILLLVFKRAGGVRLLSPLGLYIALFDIAPPFYPIDASYFSTFLIYMSVSHSKQ